MTDPVDSQLYNALKGTMFLLYNAQDWERVARDESLEPETRVYAAERARCIRAEIRPC